MFDNVLWCLASRATIGNRAATDRLKDRDIAAGIGDNSAEIGDEAAGQSGKVILPTNIDISHMSAHLYR